MFKKLSLLIAMSVMLFVSMNVWAMGAPVIVCYKANWKMAFACFKEPNQGNCNIPLVNGHEKKGDIFNLFPLTTQDKQNMPAWVTDQIRRYNLSINNCYKAEYLW